MKSYDELKAVIEIIQQRVKDTKYKSKLVLKEVNRLRKKFEFRCQICSTLSVFICNNIA